MSLHTIETVNLTKRYKKQIVVNKLNMHVKQGEIYGFLGPNGAGKTTTIRMLLGLVRPTEGEVRLFGQEFSRNRMSVLANVGSLVETPSYYGHLTGYENLEAARRLLRIEDDQRVSEVLSLVRLTKAKDNKVKDYSLGMKQRLGIATALLGRPQLLILDEPTNGLDPAGIQEIRELIKEMPRRYDTTVFVSSHLLSEVEQMATQVGIIHQGNLIFQDSITMLQKKSKSRLKVAVENPVQAERYLKQHGFNVTVHADDDILFLDDPEPRVAGKINNLLVGKGFFVYRLEEVTRSLEDIFLELTTKGHHL